MSIFIRYTPSDWDHLPLVECSERTCQVIAPNRYDFSRQCMAVQPLTETTQERII